MELQPLTRQVRYSTNNILNALDYTQVDLLLDFGN